jgi:hypothetical protein
MPRIRTRMRYTIKTSRKRPPIIAAPNRGSFS